MKQVQQRKGMHKLQRNSKVTSMELAMALVMATAGTSAVVEVWELSAQLWVHELIIYKVVSIGENNRVS
jgi:hypothetical protein